MKNCFVLGNGTYLRTYMATTIFLYPATKKPFERPSVRPSALRFRILTWVVCDRFSSIFAWIENGLNAYINNSVMALDWCKNVFFLNIFRTNGWILITICVCIDIYKIHVVSHARYFWSIFNRVMALGRRQNLFILNILWINLWISIKLCICIDIDKM